MLTQAMATYEFKPLAADGSWFRATFDADERLVAMDPEDALDGIIEFADLHPLGWFEIAFGDNHEIREVGDDEEGDGAQRVESDAVRLEGGSKEYSVIYMMPGTASGWLETQLNDGARKGFRVVAVLPMGTSDGVYVIMER
jgi:hypothetical protein